MAKKKRPGWDFDATTSVESNRRMPAVENECLCCGHVHRNKGVPSRCMARTKFSKGRWRPCQCPMKNGHRAGSREKTAGPFWGVSSGLPEHIWLYELGRWEAWTTCGLRRDRELVHSATHPVRPCRYCEKSPLATRLRKPPEPMWARDSARIAQALLAKFLAEKSRRRNSARRAGTSAASEKELREYLEWLREAMRVLDSAKFDLRHEVERLSARLPR